MILDKFFLKYEGKEGGGGGGGTRPPPPPIDPSPPEKPTLKSQALFGLMLQVTLGILRNGLKLNMMEKILVLEVSSKRHLFLDNKHVHHT